MCVLQAFFFLFDPSRTIYNAIAIGIAVVNLFFSIRYLTGQGRRPFIPVFTFYCIQLGAFLLQLISQSPTHPRMLAVSILLLHAGIILSVLLTLATTLSGKAVFFSFGLMAAIFIYELILQFQKQSTTAALSTTVTHSSHSEMKTIYPDNPGNYFHTEDPRWWLRTAGGSTASVVSLPGDQDAVRISITRVETKNAFDIQLNQSPFKVQSKHRYRLKFRARAVTNRAISLGFAMNHEPWEGLGLYETIQLTPEWQEFQKEFTPTSADSNARIHFDVGDNSIPIEVSSLHLRSEADGSLIEPSVSGKRHFVSYRFNSLGCRGPDIAIPKPSQTRRILILGDSKTLGIGVHEEDTFSSQLQRLLNHRERSSESQFTYEVINCGARNCDTKEERRFYQLSGYVYEPDIVLLVMNSDDDMSLIDQERKGYINRPPGRLELLFKSWGKVQEYWYRPPFPDFSGCVDEIIQLASDVRKQEARLLVVIFRNDPDYAGDTYNGQVWNMLIRTVTRGLESTKVPVLDLGKPLYEKHKVQDLLVHPLLDNHPNHIAHSIAARELWKFLERPKQVIQ
ncbi:carbohydrate binding domain-containing protein [bacterium]|nr:carbohydrate binding domain-containing protein [bacterium]